jgi:predicted nucleotidyltransferase
MNLESLSLAEHHALQDFVAYLRQTHPDQIQLIALFGSKARGDSQRYSDVDVLVILRQENRPLRRLILKQAARISLKWDVLLSPRVIGAERWSQMRGFSLYQNVVRDAAGLELVRGELAFSASALAV